MALKSRAKTPGAGDPACTAAVICTSASRAVALPRPVTFALCLLFIPASLAQAIAGRKGNKTAFVPVSVPTGSRHDAQTIQRIRKLEAESGSQVASRNVT